MIFKLHLISERTLRLGSIFKVNFISPTFNRVLLAWELSVKMIVYQFYFILFIHVLSVLSVLAFVCTVILSRSVFVLAVYFTLSHKRDV